MRKLGAPPPGRCAKTDGSALSQFASASADRDGARYIRSRRVGSAHPMKSRCCNIVADDYRPRRKGVAPITGRAKVRRSSPEWNDLGPALCRRDKTLSATRSAPWRSGAAIDDTMQQITACEHGFIRLAGLDGFAADSRTEHIRYARVRCAAMLGKSPKRKLGSCVISRVKGFLEFIAIQS